MDEPDFPVRVSAAEWPHQLAGGAALAGLGLVWLVSLPFAAVLAGGAGVAHLIRGAHGRRSRRPA